MLTVTMSFHNNKIKLKTNYTNSNKHKLNDTTLEVPSKLFMRCNFYRSMGFELFYLVGDIFFTFHRYVMNGE